MLSSTKRYCLLGGSCNLYSTLVHQSGHCNHVDELKAHKGLHYKFVFIIASVKLRDVGCIGGLTSEYRLYETP